MPAVLSVLGLSDSVGLLLHTCLNSTIVDLRLNENKIRSVHYSSLSRFGNLTYLNLTKNDISYVEDGAFSAQFNLQVGENMICIACRQPDNVIVPCVDTTV